MTIHGAAELAGILAVTLAGIGMLVALGRFLWRSGAAVFHLQHEVKEMKETVGECRLHLTNHIPHQLTDLQSQVQSVKDRLELHETREEKHWDLLTRVLTHEEK